jgi:ferredoxin
MAGAPSSSGPSARSEDASNSGSLEITIDAACCRAAAECVFRAPATFALDGNDKARVLATGRDSTSVIIAAARSCPNFAIAVHWDGTKLA